MWRLRESFNIDPAERNASGGCARRSADRLRRRLNLRILYFRILYFRILNLGLVLFRILFFGFLVLGFRRGIDRIGRVLLQREHL
jgi:hypothetical protein